MSAADYTSRLPTSERNRRWMLEKPWQHALERLRERHHPAAELIDVQALALRAASVYGSWRNQCRTSEGRVATYENPTSVVVQLSYGTPGKQLLVVYNPESGVLRTVLP